MTWTDHRVSSLKQLWADGLSASAIAGQLGGVTRNAVIGKVRRLGLAARATTSRRRASPPATHPWHCNTVATPRRRTPRASPLRTLLSAPAALDAMLDDELLIPPAERKSIDTLTPTSCRWPIGDPKRPDFHFCGRTKLANFPYCQLHARRAFRVTARASPPCPLKHKPTCSHPATIQEASRHGTHPNQPL
jgi:GcrA cell cycle regulator